MADPFSIDMVGGGSILSAFGKYSEGQSKAGMYGYQAGVAEINKRIAEQNAEYAIRTGEKEARRSGMQTRFDVGRIKTAQAVSGLDVNRGSTVDVRESRSEIGREDMATIRESAGRRAYGYKVEAAGEEAKARGLRSAAESAKTAGIIGGLGSLVSGASSVSSKWLQWRSLSGNDNYLSPDATMLG